MTAEELAEREEEEFKIGPLSILTQSVKNNAQVGLFPWVQIIVCLGPNQLPK